MSDELKTFGPMRGERTRRHQFVTEGAYPHEPGMIVSVFEREDRLSVEFYPADGMGRVKRANLTVEQTRWLRDALDEYVREWGSDA